MKRCSETVIYIIGVMSGICFTGTVWAYITIVLK